MTEVLKAGVLSDEIDLGALAHNAAEQAEEFVRKVAILLLFIDLASERSIYEPKERKLKWIFFPGSGLGSIMESVSLSSSTALAAGQQFPASKPSATVAVVSGLFQVGISYTHRNR